MAKLHQRFELNHTLSLLRITADIIMRIWFSKRNTGRTTIDLRYHVWPILFPFSFSPFLRYHVWPMNLEAEKFPCTKLSPPGGSNKHLCVQLASASGGSRAMRAPATFINVIQDRACPLLALLGLTTLLFLRIGLAKGHVMFPKNKTCYSSAPDVFKNCKWSRTGECCVEKSRLRWHRL